MNGNTNGNGGTDMDDANDELDAVAGTGGEAGFDDFGEAGDYDAYDVYDEFDDYDPLEVDDNEIDQEDMDDDNPLDTVDFPTMRNMPETMRREAVYTPATQGSAAKALTELFDHNPARRPQLLEILKMCEGGCASSAITERIKVLNESNRAVYEPMTYCRMLERAGGLSLEMPEVAEEKEDVEEGVEFLEIKEQIDPIWHTTDAGREIYEREIEGSAFADIVLDRDSKYIEVYQTILATLCERPMSLLEISQMVDSFEVVQTPRRFGGHFIDMLEKTYAIEWNGKVWTVTALGRSMMDAVNERVRELKAGQA